MIKSPPYKVEIGELSTPPPYVASIDETSVRIAENGCDVFVRSYEFIPRDGIYSREIKEMMLELNEQGFVFAYDYKAFISPSCFMKQLLLSGDLRTSFKEISWRSSKEWCLTEYEFE
ncbi:hypothetical protein [Vibrio nigripulchritudo]|uniref:Uncharacterized protein n=1 Tax=Vibrio nigripulchritudo SOn1 TaxID=1238450 RepID=A0AAV2VTT1_9VIBR|nr:hypothetical protein [Vibrio nigripulchritudo]CCN73770.1 conserved hypothetical protein [Vibrio nigripulchritudo SFn118]CCO48143.1 conserved hypothetical protein [Vibrio nigripulchritudo SOn1]